MLDFLVLLQQAAALMATGMLIVFAMLLALIGVIAANARVIRRLGLDRPPAAPPSAAGPGPAVAHPPVIALVAAAVAAYETDHSAS